MCTSAAARETRKTLNSIVALAHGRAARAVLDLTHRAARRPDGTMSEDRVSLSEDRHLLGVKNAAGDVIRAKSPNLKKAMGKLGIMKEDLVPPLRETFAEECKRDGVSIPDVIQKRWEVMEQRRLNEIDEVVQKRDFRLHRPTERLPSASSAPHCGHRQRLHRHQTHVPSTALG